MVDKKEATRDEIRAIFNRKRNKVEILWDALEWMQQHNCRSRTDCLALALGYKVIDDNRYLKER